MSLSTQQQRIKASTIFWSAYSDKGIEKHIRKNLKGFQIDWEQTSISGNHSRTLFGNIVCDEILAWWTFIHVDNSVERIVVYRNCLLFSHCDRPASIHMVNLSDTP